MWDSCILYCTVPQLSATVMFFVVRLRLDLAIPFGACRSSS